MQVIVFTELTQKQKPFHRKIQKAKYIHLITRKRPATAGRFFTAAQAQGRAAWLITAPFDAAFDFRPPGRFRCRRRQAAPTI